MSARYIVGHDSSEAKLGSNMETVEAFSISYLSQSAIPHQVNHHTHMALSKGVDRGKVR